MVRIRDPRIGDPLFADPRGHAEHDPSPRWHDIAMMDPMTRHRIAQRMTPREKIFALASLLGSRGSCRA